MKRGISDHPGQPSELIAKHPLSVREIYILSDTPMSQENDKNRMRLHCCQWEGQDKPCIEYRRYYLKKNGTISWRKNRPMTLDQMAAISKDWDNVIRALQS